MAGTRAHITAATQWLCCLFLSRSRGRGVFAETGVFTGSGGSWGRGHVVPENHVQRRCAAVDLGMDCIGHAQGAGDMQQSPIKSPNDALY